MAKACATIFFFLETLENDKRNLFEKIHERDTKYNWKGILSVGVIGIMNRKYTCTFIMFYFVTSPNDTSDVQHFVAAVQRGGKKTTTTKKLWL